MNEGVEDKSHHGDPQLQPGRMWKWLGSLARGQSLPLGWARVGAADSAHTLSPWDSLSPGTFTGLLLCAWGDTGGSKGLHSLYSEETRSFK